MERATPKKQKCPAPKRSGHSIYKNALECTVKYVVRAGFGQKIVQLASAVLPSPADNTKVEVPQPPYNTPSAVYFDP